MIQTKMYCFLSLKIRFVIAVKGLKYVVILNTISSYLLI